MRKGPGVRERSLRMPGSDRGSVSRKQRVTERVKERGKEMHRGQVMED